ncbi:putative quinone oxidoreductase [Cryphonectria parasitica EP155]|uniref:Quinone oxidoreductase n=1 Tax=Cryphonectria parasitica (strain ATCC 38755 / EP155) TaxID=660469 RepID=A0A9P4XZG1_CRYP1|nr:putative quinone oxidoreductase [Cryphonectria parasitica EP155]KAF3763365.1 putative quinone oxidoreductase [Cryphonectria parasitica EP155]
MSTMQRLEATKQGGPLTLVTIPKPTPNDHEVLIRTKAVGLNPVDGKSLYYGVAIESWPVVLGLEIAGVVDSVGPAVTSFQPGDEVFAWSSRFGLGAKGAAFQEFVVALDSSVAKKPASLTLEEAASIPIGFVTATSAIVVGLGVPLPGLGTTKLDQATAPKSVLVLGGSSAVGGHAIQLLRRALGTSATIVATSSPQHHGFLTKELGASTCIARADQSNVDILKGTTPGGAGFDAVLDCVGAVVEQPQILEALRADGPKLFSEVVTGLAEVSVPQGTKHAKVLGMQVFQTDGGADVISYATKLLESGEQKLPVKIEVVGTGLDAVEGGIQKLMKGVSRTKMVVTI